MSDESTKRPPGGRPGRRARLAGEVSGPASPTNPDLPVHKAAEERARSYVWEPFQPGNALSIRHGAKSEKVVGPLANQLAAWLVAEHPDLGESRYAFSISAWARAEARAALLSLYLDEQGFVDADDEARERLLAALRGEERRASEERKLLGLSPADHARLERQRAEAVVAGVASLDGIRAAGRQALEAHRERVESGARLGDDGEREETG
jgi:hypothetical protein